MRDVPQLKTIREEQGLSQRALAEMSGVAQNTLSQLERGERRAMPTTVRKLAKALGVEPSVLLREALTPRELEVLDLIVQGHTNRQIAEKLFMSEDIVKRHKKNILVKLGVSDRTQAAVMALQLGILESEAAERTQAREERRKPEAEWEAESNWIEYYVAGQAAAASQNDALGLESDEDAYLRYILLLPKSARQKERHRAWAKLDSGKLEETVELARETPLVIYKVLEESHNKQARFESIPRHYFEDLGSQHRIEKLRLALQEYQHEAIEAATELLELHAQALRQLEGLIDGMRKEGDELARVVHRTVSQFKS